MKPVVESDEPVLMDVVEFEGADIEKVRLHPSIIHALQRDLEQQKQGTSRIVALQRRQVQSQNQVIAKLEGLTPQVVELRERLDQSDEQMAAHLDRADQQVKRLYAAIKIAFRKEAQRVRKEQEEAIQLAQAKSRKFVNRQIAIAWLTSALIGAAFSVTFIELFVLH